MTTNRIDIIQQSQTTETNAAKVLAPDGVGGAQWVAGTASVSPLTTKGDVWGRSTVDARIPIGSNGQVLTADSAQTLGLKWATPSSSGATIQYPALKPATPTYDFAGAALDGAFSAHSVAGTFTTSHVMTQGIDWGGSAVELQFSAQFGSIYVTHADADFDFQWGGVYSHGLQEAAHSELMVGIAGLNSSGTGVGVVAYTADTSAYFATISTYGYNTFSDSWATGVMGTRDNMAGPLWFRLKRVSGTWTGYMSKSGRVWDKTFSTRADSITLAQLHFGIWFDSSKTYSGRVTADYCDVAV